MHASWTDRDQLIKSPCPGVHFTKVRINLLTVPFRDHALNTFIYTKLHVHVGESYPNLQAFIVVMGHNFFILELAVIIHVPASAVSMDIITFCLKQSTLKRPQAVLGT